MRNTDGKFLLEKFKQAQELAETETYESISHFEFLIKLIFSKEDELQDDADFCLLMFYALPYTQHSLQTEINDKTIYYGERAIALSKNKNKIPYYVYRKLADYYLVKKNFLKAAYYFDLEHFSSQEYFYDSNAHIPIGTPFKDIKNLVDYKIASPEIVKYNQEMKKIKMTACKKAGELYLKAGTQYALNYWGKQIESTYYLTSKIFKEDVDKEYLKALEKHNKGYVYKPRKKV